MPPEQRMHEVAARIEALIGDFAASPEPALQRKAQELVKLLMELYGAGLAKMLEILERDERDTTRLVEAMANDELIGSLLTLHDLHPQDSRARIVRELERVRAVAGVEVTLVEMREASARVQVHGQTRSGRISPVELRKLIEGVVQAAAPEVDHVEIEGLGDAATPELVQLTRTRPAARKTEGPLR